MNKKTNRVMTEKKNADKNLRLTALIESIARPLASLAA